MACRVSPWVRGALGIWLVGCVAPDDTSVDDTPSVDTPAVDTPVVDTPVVDTPQDTGLPPRDAPCVSPRPPRGTSSTEPIRFESRKLVDGWGPTSCFGADDLDNDGLVDLWWGEASTGELVLMWGEADGGFDMARPRLGIGVSGCLLLPDPDPTGRALWVAASGAIARVIIGPDRQVTADPPRTVAAANGDVHAMAAADLDRDGRFELLFTQSGRGDVCVEPVIGPDGSVTLPSIQEKGAEVHCARRGEDGSWSEAPALCPDAFDAIDATFPFTLALQDVNEDGAPEILMAGDFGTSRLAVSGADGWTDESQIAGVGRYGHAMGASWADFDGDGLRDLYMTDYGPDRYYLNLGCPLLFDSGFDRGVTDFTRYTITWGVSAADYDLDGDPDVLVGMNMEPGPDRFRYSVCDLVDSGEPAPGPFLLRNDGRGHMTERQYLMTTDDEAGISALSLLPLDLDGDGDLDAFSAQQDGGLWLHRNVGAYAGHWVEVAPRLADGAPAWGARVTVREGSRARLAELWAESHTNGQAPPITHFGLGGTTASEVQVEVRWPDGEITTAVVPVDARTIVTR